jgi:hypothetical protein
MADAPSANAPLRYGDIVVIGGGCYGSFYVRQLNRAAAAGAVEWTRLLVIDRDAACRVAGESLARGHTQSAPALVVQEWGAFLDEWIPRDSGPAPDTIVPSPLMPHLCLEFLMRRAATGVPDRRVERVALDAPVGTPWERAAPDGTAYVSHATWTCPINCIEPHVCPHTKGPRDWTMPASISEWTQAQRAAGNALVGPFTFHCTHRAFGVGMIDKERIRAADLAIRAAAQRGPVRAVVATASHCHGAVALLSIGERNGVEGVESSATTGEISRR